MILTTWRTHHGLSLASAAELFGLSSAGHLQRIERGETWVGPEVMLRIMAATRALGPSGVTAVDMVRQWELAHKKVADAVRLDTANIVREFNNAKESQKA